MDYVCKTHDHIVLQTFELVGLWLG